MDGGTLTCLLHGDSWNNNLLFRYPAENSDQAEEMLLIDWQIARCGHPSSDLGYFLFSSTSSAFRRQHLDSLFQEYYTILDTALAKIGINLDKEGYSQEQFMQETKQRYVLIMMIALFILPILLDASKAVDHTLKDQDISKDLKPITANKGMYKKLYLLVISIPLLHFCLFTYSNSADVDQAKELDEEGTKSGWQSLFEPDTVLANPLLSQRIVELISDVKDMYWKESS